MGPWSILRDTQVPLTAPTVNIDLAACGQGNMKAGTADYKGLDDTGGSAIPMNHGGYRAVSAHSVKE